MVQPANIDWLHASVKDDLLSLAGQGTRAESRWNRPCKRRTSLRWMWKGGLVQVERTGLPDANQSDLEKSNGGGKEHA